jgi:carbon-monoxide dehydrogenase catalytic subunit
MIATAVSDILFGTPKPVRSRVNLGVLSSRKVNIIVHGHEPTLSDMLATAAMDEELIEYAKEKGIQDITEKMTKDEIIERIQTHG